MTTYSGICIDGPHKGHRMVIRGKCFEIPALLEEPDKSKRNWFNQCRIETFTYNFFPIGRGDMGVWTVGDAEGLPDAIAAYEGWVKP